MRLQIPGSTASLEIPDSDWNATPKSVHEAYGKIIAALVTTISALQKRVEVLEEKLNTNSRNSGKPPSSDPPGTLPNRGKPNKGEKQRGGQPGHDGRTRRAFPEQEVDVSLIVSPEHCESCGHCLAGVVALPYLTHQILELLEKPYSVTEFQLKSRLCPCCDKVCHGHLPDGVSSRNFGPRLTAALSLMAGVFHMSRRDITSLAKDILGITISLGTVSSLEGLVTDAIAGAHQEVADAIQLEETAGIDDSGWRRDNKFACLWAMTSKRLTLYKITGDKSEKSAAAVVGKFSGVLTSDRAKNLDFFVGWRQTCWAHLDRHFKRMSERPGQSAQVGLDAMAVHDQVFHIWHQYKAGDLDADQLFAALKGPRIELQSILERGSRCGHSKTQNTCFNLLEIYDRFWTFSYLDGVEPTNNATEQKIRTGVLWRKTSHGSQSDRGTRFAESILTVAATCRQQGLSTLTFLEESLVAFLKKIPGPTLRPAPA